MTRIPGNYLAGEIELRVAPKMKDLRSLSDDLLVAKLKEGLEYATRMDAASVQMNIFEISVSHQEYYEGIAAQRLLTERHGADYVLNLMGLRQPQTATERLVHFFTGVFPELQTAGAK